MKARREQTRDRSSNWHLDSLQIENSRSAASPGLNATLHVRDDDGFARVSKKRPETPALCFEIFPRPEASDRFADNPRHRLHIGEGAFVRIPSFAEEEVEHRLNLAASEHRYGRPTLRLKPFRG
jgi:hypothetical protein